MLVFNAVHVMSEGHQLHLQLAQPALAEGTCQLSNTVHAGGIHDQGVKGMDELLHTRRYLEMG